MATKAESELQEARDAVERAEVLRDCAAEILRDAVANWNAKFRVAWSETGERRA